MAVGWMRAMRPGLFFDDHGRDRGLGDLLAVDARLAGELPYPAAVAELLDVVLDDHARVNRAPELRLIDAHEINQRRLLAAVAADRRRADRSGSLRDAFDQQHAGHHRMTREVPHEMRLVDRDRLDADGGIVTIDLDD